MEISYALRYDPSRSNLHEVDVHNPNTPEVMEIKVSSIKTRFRLRTPDDDKIKELADSIKITGLINPITIDPNHYLIAGFHRWSAYKELGYDYIPAIIKDVSKFQSELMEIDENLKRNELNHIEIAEHIVRREELLEELGVRMKRGGNQYTTGFLTTTELAEQLGMSNRIYRLKRQPAEIHPEVKEELKYTPFAKNLMDMVKLSREDDHIQIKVGSLLSTGKFRTFKRALAAAKLEDYRRDNEYDTDFDIKERWGIPQTIMRFKKAEVPLQEVCNLISKDEELEFTKRKGINFGQSEIPVYGMAADLAEFLITYYTPKNGLVLDQFSGRFTIGAAALYHGRRFVGYDLNPKNVRRAAEVFSKHLSSDPSNFELHNSDGVTLQEFDCYTEHFDAIVTDPPYVLKAEKYTDDERDLCNCSHDEFLKRIKLNFHRCYELIKTSDFNRKEFYPVIFKTGTGRRGKSGIVDMDSIFQNIANEVGFTLWDKLTNQLHTPYAAVNFERNFKLKYVQKNYEVSLVFVKFD